MYFFNVKLNKKKRNPLEIEYFHIENGHPRKPNSKLCYLKWGIRGLFYIPIAKSRLYIYRVSRPFRPAGLASTHVPDRCTQLERERDRFIYERLQRSLTGRIVTGHPVEWSIGGGQRVLRWQSVSDGGLSRYGSTTPQTSILKPS